MTEFREAIETESDCLLCRGFGRVKKIEGDTANEPKGYAGYKYCSCRLGQEMAKASA